MTLAPGEHLGGFTIHSPLGHGGMGEVYRATDTRLGRDVAVKVLPADVAGDADRLARFEREARLLAALNHPNIAHVYGFERAARADGTTVHFLAMELVPGEDLAQRLARGAIPVDEAVALARQIAEALEEAHEAGIIHRDLKPANIKLTPDGKVKVLDFGLAKASSADAAGASSADLSHSPTFAGSQTQTGVILGTAAYMSPEQVRGRPVDRRADIWAFGVVLFEMLTGRRLFAGETVSDLLASVLRTDPDWTALPADTPRRVRALLRRCLERDPKRRLRDIGEARLALDDASSDRDDTPTAAAPGPAAAGTAVWAWVAALIVVASIGLAGGRFALAPERSEPAPVRFEIDAGAVASAVLSPDGSKLAIASQGKLWLRDLSQLALRAIDGTDGAIRPFWSPDGRTIAYGARGKLWKVTADAGTPAAISDLPGGLWDADAGGAWLADGSIVFSNGNAGLWQVASQGGDPVEVLKPDPARELHFHTVTALPDGRSVVYVVHRSGEGASSNTLGLWSGGKAQVLHEAAGQILDDPVYSPSGHLLFRRAPTSAGVWALPFSLDTLTATGEPFPVAQGMRGPSVAANGTLVLLPPRRQRPMNLAWTERDGTIVSRIDEPRFRETAVAISPDGNLVANAELVDGKSDIWLYDVQRKTRRRLTSDGVSATPVWMPDGRSLVYNARTTTGQGIAMRQVMADGSGRVDELGDGRRPAVALGSGALFYTLADTNGMRLWYRERVKADAKPALFIPNAAYGIVPAPSPDGRFVAYAAEPGPNQAEIYLRRFPPSEEVWQVSTSGGTSPRWSRDGRLFFARGAEIFEVEVTTAPDVRIGVPTRLFTRAVSAGVAVPPPFDVSPDGKRFLIFEPVGDPSEERIVVMLDWYADLEK